ncbi:MAG TPA: PadR family transcriptional regulator [Mycobacterium sp.]|nr:PadR family transcriptional regulator [Mycobacterium sp.]
MVSQFLRGAVRLHILHHTDIEPVHGAWMTEELSGHGYNISPGTLYPMLHRMQNDGLLTSRSEVVDGRARRVYTITDEGRAVLVEERAALAELAAEVLGGQEES